MSHIKEKEKKGCRAGRQQEWQNRARRIEGRRRSDSAVTVRQKKR